MAQFYSAKRRVTTRQIITVKVNDLDSFGQGVARHNGKALFIPGLLPEESAEVIITEDKKQFARARVSRRLNDSPERETPRCPHFGVCGGCQQQHVSIALQQRSKSAALARLMKHEVNDIIAGAPWGYRRRARLSLNCPPDKPLQMGFRKAGSSDIVNVEQCPVLAPQLAALLPRIRACLASLHGTRHLGHVELVQAGSGTLMILRHTAPLSAADKEKLERFSHSEGLSLFLAPFSEILETVSGEAPWYDSHGLRLAFSPRDFIQVNEAVNQQMVARALVEKGRENAIRNGLHNVTFFHENLEEDVTKQPWAKNGFDKVLLDPARAGATGVMRHIIKLKPIRIVYVSCNPATLARDSEALVNAGYEVTRLAMLDMFPHTGHLESMVLFERM
ncbi:23S rRNA (uracil(1939)-C(5))-methyltransferase RlmD [Salmonella enterica subsp. enterica]|nr:23S rRNA (uracil(1939)-C(5))-methyltransferase RlmD [Salmonella enterica subsp. enterica]